jgi:ATP-dependent helicase/nuclease subunit A
MKWTDKQEKAITDRGHNLLVAAAAGSGKTAVLVERIKKLILEDKCPIDRMLIVTFTNAAASEMKEKIEKAIRDEIRELSASGDASKKGDISLLKRQLDLLPSANISTFHSFSMEVVRRFFFLTGCEPDFRICDEANGIMLQDKAMDKLMGKLYEEGGEPFYDFLDKFSGDRTDERARSMIKELSDRLESLPEPYEWLREKTEELHVDMEDFLKGSAMDFLWDEAGKTIERCHDLLKESLMETKLNRLTKGQLLAVSDLSNVEALRVPIHDRNFEETKRILSVTKWDSLRKDHFNEKANPDADPNVLWPVYSAVGTRRNNVKKAFESLKKGLFSETVDQMYEDMRTTYDDAVYLGGLVKEYRDIYSEIKRSKGLMDFSDLEHFAYEILKHDEACDHYREKFLHIFVDEYQDSNVLQEALIGRIARKNNLFTVGDVKQSIYRFRLAEPEIFENRYARYKAEFEEYGESGDSLKIDLNKNFRSKDSVIDLINGVFSEVMDNYGEDEALYADKPLSSRSNHSPKLFLVSDSWADDEDLDDAIKDLKKTEKEALLTVKLIRESLGKIIYDNKAGIERPLSLKDIVILMRGVKDKGDIFYNVLMENNIPCFVDDNKGYFDTIEINTFMSLLELVDNPKQDLQLLTVMRSEIWRFEIRELAELRACHKKVPYYECVRAYAEDGADEELRSKAKKVLSDLSEWRRMAEALPLEELVWTLMTETGFYSSMGAMPGGTVRQANLRLLADKALDYRRNRGSGLYGFIGYVDHIKKKDIKMGQARVVTEDDDTVRIMTIHHSKGLEFPMVIIAGFTRKLGGDNRKNGLMTDKDLGIGLPIVRRKEKWYRETALQRLIARKSSADDDKEEERVLYVAMTRAKDILYMTGTAKDPYDAVDKIGSSLKDDSSFFNMAGKVLASRPGLINIVSDQDLGKTAGLRKRSALKALKLLDKAPGKPDPYIEKVMSFRYPYEDDTRIKSKYSVSELNSRDHVSEVTFDPSVPREPEKYGLSAVHIGTITHSVLEKMDFLKTGELDRDEGEKLISSLISDMVAGEFLNDEEAEAIDVSKLYDFACAPLGRRIAEAGRRGKLYREKPFNLVMDVDGSDAMVQGIIDCFFEENGSLVLVDYKTTAPKNVPGVRERYSVQMDIYKRALEEATGMKVAESYLYLTNLGITVDMNG